MTDRAADSDRVTERLRELEAEAKARLERPADPDGKCARCGGTGRVVENVYSLTSQPCPQCCSEPQP